MSGADPYLCPLRTRETEGNLNGANGNMFESIAEAVSLMNNRMDELALDIRKALDGLENRLESHWSRVARCGWFPNWETSISIGSALSSGQSAIDAFMIREIEESWGVRLGNTGSLSEKKQYIKGRVRLTQRR